MKNCHLSLMVLMAGIAFTTFTEAAPSRLISGEIAADQSQAIIAPMSPSWNLRIDWMAEEGSLLKVGDLAVRFDNSANDSQIQTVTDTIEKTRAEGARTVARLEKAAALAGYDIKTARIRVQLATNEALIEARFIGALNYADNQLMLSRAEQDLLKAEKNAEDQEKKLTEATLKTALDEAQIETNLAWFQQLTEGNSIYAELDGSILYKSNPWGRNKFRAGDDVQTSVHVADVVNNANMYVRLYINAVDRPNMEVEQAVKIYLDAYPGKPYFGRITKLLAQGESRQEWGKGLYMQGRVEFDPGQELPELMPGMSVLVEVSQ